MHHLNVTPDFLYVQILGSDSFQMQGHVKRNCQLSCLILVRFSLADRFFPDVSVTVVVQGSDILRQSEYVFSQPVLANVCFLPQSILFSSLSCPFYFVKDMKTCYFSTGSNDYIIHIKMDMQQIFIEDSCKLKDVTLRSKVS